jgi:hypothetical protein
MLQSRWLGRRHAIAAAAILLSIGVGTLRAKNAASEPAVVDGAPSGMVTFVAGGVCPPGWVHLYDVEGRVVVGTVTKNDVGVTVGKPFGDREERLHKHDYEGAVELPKKNIAGANGGNNSGAGNGSYPVAGETSEDASGLPFVQMEGCVRP